MNIPNFPTDNLYKFVAVAGLVLAGYSAFFAYQQVWELKLQILRTETEEKVVDQEMRMMGKSLDRLLEKEKISEAERQKVADRGVTVFTKRIRIDGKIKENNLLNEQLQVHYLIFWSGIVGGFLMSGCGFYLWYTRVQKPNERLQNRHFSN